MFNNIIFFLNTECPVLSDDLFDVIQYVFTAIKIAVPILIVVLIIMDMVKATASGDDKAVKEATGTAIKRLVIGVAIFFLPTLINLLLNMVGFLSGTCGIS